MKKIINKNKITHSKQALNALDLLLKEFELAYNLSPELNPKSLEKLKKHILSILDSGNVGQVEGKNQKHFSFKAESLLGLSNFLQET